MCQSGKPQDGRRRNRRPNSFVLTGTKNALEDGSDWREVQKAENVEREWDTTCVGFLKWLLRTPQELGSTVAFGWLRGLDLNQRPLGYEPNELPDCSTPRTNNIRTCDL